MNNNPKEPAININGTVLSQGQAMAVRVAVTNFLFDMQSVGVLGDDETGEAIRLGYHARLSEVTNLMIGQ